jgi:putative transposase
MKKKRVTEEQIIGILKEGEAGVSTADLCRKHGMSSASFYSWRSRYAAAKHTAATWPMEQFSMSQRRVCRVLKLCRATFRYVARKSKGRVLGERLRALA